MAYDAVLRSQIHSGDAVTRGRAISRIAWARHVELADDLMEVLGTDPKSEVRGRAAWALGKLRHGEAHAQLLGCLKAREAEVRKWSAWALGELGVYSDVPLIARLAANEQRHEVRQAMFGAVRKLRIEPTRIHVSRIERLLQPPSSGDSRVMQIVEALAPLDWPQDRAQIVALRRELKEVDSRYFSTYMQWLERKPTIQQAVDNPRLVFR